MPATTPADQPPGLRMAGIAEAQGVQQRDRPRAHGEDVAHDAADAGRRALVGLDVGGVVVALHLEDAGLAVADVDDAGVLARAADHPRPRGRELAEVHLATTCRSSARDHITEKTPSSTWFGSRFRRWTMTSYSSALQAVLGGRLGHGLGGGEAHGGLLAGLGGEGEGRRAFGRCRSVSRPSTSAASCYLKRKSPPSRLAQWGP